MGKRLNIGQLIIDLPEPYFEINFYYRWENWMMEKHQHRYYQIILVTDGVLLLQHGGNCFQMRRGQVCIIPPYHPHALDTVTGYHQFGVNFQEEHDHRGLLALLHSHVKDMIILDKPDVLELLPELQKDCEQLTNLSKLKVTSCLDRIVFACLEGTLHVQEIDFRNRLLSYLRNHLSDKITLKELCMELAVSQSQIERLTYREFGCGVIELFNRLRVQKACSLLTNQNLSIAEISASLGFYDQAHFSRFFKRKMKLNPTQYRKLRTE